jgi:hypothetical protein
MMNPWAHLIVPKIRVPSETFLVQRIGNTKLSTSGNKERSEIQNVFIFALNQLVAPVY